MWSNLVVGKMREILCQFPGNACFEAVRNEGSQVTQHLRRGDDNQSVEIPVIILSHEASNDLAGKVVLGVALWT